MGVMSTSARVRARRRLIERVAERAAFAREQAARDEVAVDPAEEEAPSPADLGMVVSEDGPAS